MPKISEGILVSVVIPTLNEEAYIGNLIKMLVNQTHKNMEIIVVDGGSTDRTREIINSFSSDKIKSFVAPSTGPARARNLGAEKASGDVILFLDADTAKINDSFLEYALEHFKDPGVVGVHTKGFSTADTLIERAVYYAAAPEVPIDMPPSLIKLDIFKQLGGFEDVGFGEDRLLGIKFTEMLRTTGNRVVFEPMSQVTTHDPHTLREFWTQQKWYGRTFPFYAAKAGLDLQEYINFYLNTLLSCSTFFIFFVPRFPILIINLTPILFTFVLHILKGIKHSNLKISLARFLLILMGGFAKSLGMLEYLFGKGRIGR